MLQTVHQKPAAPRASSFIYRRSIGESRKEGAPLVAVWIDSDMRRFDNDFTAHSELVQQGSLEEPGGSSSFRSLVRTAIGGIAPPLQ